MHVRAGIVWLGLSLTQTVSAESLMIDQFRHITFDKITQTRYEQDGTGIKAEVAGSSSFLLKAFPAVRAVKGLKWKWKFAGDYKVTTVGQLSSKKGDDTIFRVGLIKSGSAPMVPFFAPAWIQAINEHMKQPGDAMVYYVAGGPAKPGSQWESPYSDSMALIQTESVAIADGWFQVVQEISPPIRATGLWLMADGDNTGSKFTTWVKDLELVE
jgi:hypothetical protein